MPIRARIFFNWKVIFLLIGDDLCHNPLHLGLPSSISVVLTLRKALTVSSRRMWMFCRE